MLQLQLWDLHAAWGELHCAFLRLILREMYLQCVPSSTFP